MPSTNYIGLMQQIFVLSSDGDNEHLVQRPLVAIICTMSVSSIP